ncbi:MAG: MFS transporter [Lachnospiraceae bacterium]|nr:MFS transporter [Lachnospiraceae bacterium]
MEKKKNKDLSSNFGKWGWSIIIMCLIAYFISGGVAADGLNIYVGAITAVHPTLDAAKMLSFSSIGGWIGVVVTYICGQITAKNLKATKPIMIVTLFITAILMYLYGHTDSTALVCVCIAGVSAIGCGYGQIATNNIQTAWFPRRKALALGWSTMGFPLCTMVWPFVTNLLLKTVGVGGMFLVIAIFICLFAIATIWWCKVTPQEVGKAPDNDPLSAEEIAAQQKMIAQYKSPWTLGKCLSEKRVWFISIGLGLVWMVTVCMVMRTVPTLIMSGWTQDKAVLMLSVVGFFGLFGSYIWGWLDQKLSTRTACLLYCCWYIIALLCMGFSPKVHFLTYVGIFMLGISVGGICNLIPSFVGTIFGWKDFPAVNRVVSTITKLICACAGVYMGNMEVAVGVSNAFFILIAACVIAFILVFLVKPLPQSAAPVEEKAE